MKSVAITFVASTLVYILIQQRVSYDDYVPVGLLKSSWLDKHTKQLPSVLVFFYDLDWNDAHWEEKKVECAAKLQALRWGGWEREGVVGGEEEEMSTAADCGTP